MNTIEIRLKQIIGQLFDVPTTEIVGQSCLPKDFSIDSLDLVELVMAIEKEFEIEIPDDKIDELVTFNKLLDFVTEKVYS